MFRGGPDILSRPLKLHWAGWTADTYSLQQAGWQLSAQQEVMRGGMRIALKHDGLRLHAITTVLDYDYQRAVQDRYNMPRMELVVQHMASQLRVEIHEPASALFSPIDATPQFIADRQIKSFEDFAHFAPPLTRTREIILPEQNVPELMDMILKLQQPDRTEYLKRQLGGEGYQIDAQPRQKFHAQILSIAA